MISANPAVEREADADLAPGFILHRLLSGRHRGALFRVTLPRYATR